MFILKGASGLWFVIEDTLFIYSLSIFLGENAYWFRSPSSSVIVGWTIEQIQKKGLLFVISCLH